MNTTNKTTTTVEAPYSPLVNLREKKLIPGNGKSTYKNLTSAVKAAEKEKEEAKKHAAKAELFAELAGNSANMTNLNLREFSRETKKLRSYLARCIVIVLLGLIGHIVAIFC